MIVHANGRQNKPRLNYLGPLHFIRKMSIKALIGK